MATADPVTLLVVEDDDLDFKALTRALKALKIANPVRRAMDGLAALALLRGESGEAPVGRPRVILLDLKMPRMGGIEFLDALRADAALHGEAVYVLTSSDADEDIADCRARGIAGYLRKSDDTEGFAEALQAICRHGRMDDC